MAKSKDKITSRSRAKFLRGYIVKMRQLEASIGDELATMEQASNAYAYNKIRQASAYLGKAVGHLDVACDDMAWRR